MEKLRLAIVNDSLNMLDLLVGMELGFYEKEGLQVEPVPLAGRRAVEALLQGEVDVTVQVGPALRAFGAGRRDLRLLLMIHVNPPHWLLARPGAGGVEDLRGKKVWVGSLESDIGFLIRKWIEGRGVNPERDVTLLYHPFEPFWTRALVRMTADVVMAVPPEKAVLESGGYTPLVEITEAFPHWLTHGFITTSENLERRAEDWRRLLRAQCAVARFLRDSGEKVVDYVRRRWHIEAEHARDCCDLLRGRMFADRPEPYLEGPLALVRETGGAGLSDPAEFIRDPRGLGLLAGLGVVPASGASSA